MDKTNLHWRVFAHPRTGVQILVVLERLVEAEEMGRAIEAGFEEEEITRESSSMRIIAFYFM